MTNLPNKNPHYYNYIDEKKITIYYILVVFTKI